MNDFFDSFCRDEQAQDLIEYSLLIALVALASIAIFSTSTQNMGGIWKTEDNVLIVGNSLAAS
jgi:Flp pilus assembly pilin Flp